MAVVRWGRAALDGAVLPKVRWGRVGLDGTAPLLPKVRWGRAELSGVASVIVNPIAAQTVEPETNVTVTAVLVGGGTADSYTWRRISGPAISFIGSGDSRTFRAPSAMPPGTSVAIGVTATIGGTVSPEQPVTITVLPQVQWSYSAGAWVGQRPAVSL